MQKFTAAFLSAVLASSFCLSAQAADPSIPDPFAALKQGNSARHPDSHSRRSRL